MSPDTQRKITLLGKQAHAAAHLPRAEGQSIAEFVQANFESTGFVAVPDGEYAAAVSHRQSSDPSEPNRSLHLIFSDGSDVCICYGEIAGFSPAGDTNAELRFEAARKIAPELNLRSSGVGSAAKALSDFEHGFVTAAALAARLGDPNLAAKMLGQAGFQGLDCSELNEFDKQQLQLVNQQPGINLLGLSKR